MTWEINFRYFPPLQGRKRKGMTENAIMSVSAGGKKQE